MVHALHEAHRVLKPGGVLVDLRPAPKHRRVGLGERKRWRLIGVMREKFDDDRAADHAVKRVLREGLFYPGTRAAFEADRVMDTMQDFREWLDDFIRLGKTMPSHTWFVERLERALKKERAGTKIVVRGPMMLNVMRKLGDAAIGSLGNRRPPQQTITAWSGARRLVRSEMKVGAAVLSGDVAGYPEVRSLR